MGLSLEAPLAGVSSGTGEQSTHLLSPKFRGRESGFSALQEWESDISKYEGESGTDKAYRTKTRRALLMVESSNTSKQQLAMHASKLSKYI